MAFTATAYSKTACDTQFGGNMNVYIYHATDNDNTTLTIADNGVRVEWGNQSGDILDPIMDVIATVRVVADTTDETFLSDIDTADDGTYLLVINVNSTEIFRGLIEPDLGGRSQQSNGEVVIRARSGLTYLQGIDFPTTTDTRVSVLAVLDEALQSMGYALGYKTDNNVYPDGVASTDDVLVNTFINRSIYKRYSGGREVITSCYDVIKDICLRFGLTITQWGGYWHIQHWPQYASGDRRYWEYNTSLAEQSETLATPTVTYNGTSFQMVREWPIISHRLAYGKFLLNYDHQTKWDYWRNGSFELDLAADNWVKTGSNQDRVYTENFSVNPFSFNVLRGKLPEPSAEAFNNRSLRFDTYFNPNGPTADPPAAIPYVKNLSRFDFEKGVANEYTLRFSVYGIPSEVNGGIRQNARYFWWRLYDEAGTYYYDSSHSNAQTFTVSSVDTANDRITFTEAVGGDHNMEVGEEYYALYTTSGTPMTGLTSGNFYPITRYDEDTVTIGVNITGIGSGTQTFQLTHWIDTATYNREMIRPGEEKEFQFKINAIPVSDQYYLEIYGPQDHVVAAKPTEAGTASFDITEWKKPSTYDTTLNVELPDYDWEPDLIGMLVDSVLINTADDRETSRVTTLESTERVREHDELTVRIGEGPFDITDAAISTSASGGYRDYPAQNWDGLGLADKGLDEWLLRTYSKFKGAPRVKKDLRFKYVNANANPVTALVIDSVRHHPVHFFIEPIIGEFGGSFLKFASASNTVTVSEYNDVTVYTIRGATGVTGYNILSEITDNIGLQQGGELRLGTGTVGTDFTGIRIYKDDVSDPEVYRVSGWNNDTIQAYLDSDGKFYAGGGAVTLDVNGLDLDVWGGIGVIGDDPSKAITFGGDQYFIYVTDQGISAPQINIWSKDTDGKINITSGSASGNITVTSADDIVLTATNIDVGASLLKDSDDSTGSSGQVLSQDAGGLVWADAAVGYATSSGKGNDGKVYLAVDVTTDNTWVSVPDTSAAALGTHFDDNVDVTYLTGRVAIWSETSAQKSIWNVDAVVVTSIAGVQSILDQNVTEHYATSTGSHSVQFAIVSDKVNLQAKDTSNVANLSNITTATIEWTSARSPTYAT